MKYYKLIWLRWSFRNFLSPSNLGQVCVTFVKVTKDLNEIWFLICEFMKYHFGCGLKLNCINSGNLYIQFDYALDPARGGFIHLYRNQFLWCVLQAYMWFWAESLGYSLTIIIKIIKNINLIGYINDFKSNENFEVSWLINKF